jgi:hypothetical protein
LKKKQLILGLLVLAAIVTLAVYAQQKYPFHWQTFLAQFKLANWGKIALGIGCIYVGFLFRSARWALLLRPFKKVGPLSLLGTQAIGFTAVALIGRIADPVRPFLVARKTGLRVSNQIAVYIVERLFDFGSMALIFSVAMLWIPDAEILQATGHSGMLTGFLHHSPVSPATIARYGGLVITLMAALFLVAVRLAGGLVAAFLEHAFGLISKSLGRAIGQKVNTFRAGLNTIRSFSDFAATAALSLVMWVVIALAYLETMQAFVDSPQLASITPAKCVLLMTASGGASIFQLPIVGWFSQIFIVAAALYGFFGAAWEPAMACAATLLAVTFLSIVPVGLVWARFEHVSLRKVAEESGHAGDEVEDPEEAES